MKNSLWIPVAMMLTGIVLGVLVLGPQSVLAQEGETYFTPFPGFPVTVECDGTQYVWPEGELPARKAAIGPLWEVFANGRWCTMLPQANGVTIRIAQQEDPANPISQTMEGSVEMPEWVPGMAIITIFAAVLLLAAPIVFRWWIKRQRSEVSLDEVFNEISY